MANQMIKTIEDFIQAVCSDSKSWHPNEPKWFRGEPKSDTPLLPTLYRDGLAQYENPLLQMFRARASGYHDVVPDLERTDQWLFLAQHVGLPTRLLDWTKGALLGLHFALKYKDPVVWMLNPLDLNDVATVGFAKISSHEGPMRQFPLTWFNKPGNIGFENIGAAWTEDQGGTEVPVAVYPTYVHPRLRAQRSCFTVHGELKQGLNTLLPDSILKRYAVDPNYCQSIIEQLRTLGVTETVAFPDLDGLAKELRAQFSS